MSTDTTPPSPEAVAALLRDALNDSAVVAVAQKVLLSEVDGLRRRGRPVWVGPILRAAAATFSANASATPGDAAITKRRVPQLHDDSVIELRLPPQTEEWADDLLSETDERVGFDVERTDDALIVRTTIGGNCNAIVVARGFLDDVEDYLRDGDIDPMEFTLTVTAREPRPDR
jgi:hypothetical protein